MSCKGDAHGVGCDHIWGVMCQADIEYCRERGYIICGQCMRNVSVQAMCENCGNCTACKVPDPGHLSACAWGYPGVWERGEARYRMERGFSDGCVM